jgi:hypothetical protein
MAMAVDNELEEVTSFRRCFWRCRAKRSWRKVEALPLCDSTVEDGANRERDVVDDDDVYGMNTEAETHSASKAATRANTVVAAMVFILSSTQYPRYPRLLCRLGKICIVTYADPDVCESEQILTVNRVEVINTNDISSYIAEQDITGIQIERFLTIQHTQ